MASTSATQILPDSKFQSAGEFAVTQFLGSRGRHAQSLANLSLNFPRSPGLSCSSAPLRQIQLRGGDRITAEIVRWEDEEIELRLRGGQTVAISRSAIAEVSVPDGEIESLYAAFERELPVFFDSDTLAIQPSINANWLDSVHAAGGKRSLNLARASQPVEITFASPIEASRVQFWFQIGQPIGVIASDASVAQNILPPGLRIELNFSGEEPQSQWSVVVTANEATVSINGGTENRATRQTVPLSRGWHCLTAALFTDHALCAVDQSLLVSTVRSPGMLRSIRMSSGSPAWIDDMQISRLNSVPRPTVVRASTQDDCVARQDGDQWFGRARQVTATGVLLSSATESRSIPWQQIERIALRQADRPAPNRALPAGLWARLEFQPSIDRPRQAPDQIRGIVTHVNRDYFVVAHPSLGDFAIGWNQIARIDPLFFGRMIAVDARTVHLGDAIREDFRRPVPDGTEWSAEFEVPPRELGPETEIWLSLDAVDLEPSGVETPPGSPFLKELRAGNLLTKVEVNDEPAGDLNCWIRFRATPERPERLRCRIPTELLRSGPNTIRFRQTPLQESGARFDNCELSNFGIEILDVTMNH